MNNTELKMFVAALVDEFPLADPAAVKIYHFYKEWEKNNE